LGDFVWHDANNNLFQDAADVGLPNVVVTLFDVNGTQIGSTLTDTTGHYEFDSLNHPIMPNGTYTIAIADQAAIGQRQPAPADTTNDLLDSDAQCEFVENNKNSYNSLT
jgi:hypothetical protein